MHPPNVPTVSRVVLGRSRQLMHDSRARIASAQEVLRQARQSLARQRYLRIVCAWCQQTIRWRRAQEPALRPISHSICFDCFADVFRELSPARPTPVAALLLPEVTPPGAALVAPAPEHYVMPHTRDAVPAVDTAERDGGLLHNSPPSLGA